MAQTFLGPGDRDAIGSNQTGAIVVDIVDSGDSVDIITGAKQRAVDCIRMD